MGKETALTGGGCVSPVSPMAFEAHHFICSDVTFPIRRHQVKRGRDTSGSPIPLFSVDAVIEIDNTGRS